MFLIKISSFLSETVPKRSKASVQTSCSASGWHLLFWLWVHFPHSQRWNFRWCYPDSLHQVFNTYSILQWSSLSVKATQHCLQMQTWVFFRYRLPWCAPQCRSPSVIQGLQLCCVDNAERRRFGGDSETPTTPSGPGKLLTLCGMSLLLILKMRRKQEKTNTVPGSIMSEESYSLMVVILFSIAVLMIYDICRKHVQHLIFVCWGSRQNVEIVEVWHGKRDMLLKSPDMAVKGHVCSLATTELMMSHPALSTVDGGMYA